MRSAVEIDAELDSILRIILAIDAESDNILRIALKIDVGSHSILRIALKLHEICAVDEFEDHPQTNTQCSMRIKNNDDATNRWCVEDRPQKYSKSCRRHRIEGSPPLPSGNYL